MLKTLSALLFLAVAAGCAFVFEAASVADRVTGLAGDAVQAESPGLRTALLSRAESIAAASWAAPGRWHARTLDALGWVHALQADQAASEPALREEAAARSVAASEAAVRLAPVQGAAWFRLAGYAHSGVPNGVCQPAACLDNSWRATPMTANYELACGRLRLAHALGQTITHDDWRVANFAASGFGRQRIASCLGFMDPGEMFQVLLQAG